MWAECPGRTSASEDSIEVRAGETAEVDLRLPLGASLSGRVLDAEGSPLPGARVYVGGAFSPTDPYGRFHATGARRGTQWVSAKMDGFASSGIVAEVPGPEVALRLDRLATIAGRVRDPSGAALPEGRVGAFRCGPHAATSSVPWTSTDGTGRFSLEVPGGSYILEVEVRDRASWRVTVTVPPGSHRWVDIEVGRDCQVSGRVVLAGSGTPVGSAVLRIERPDGSCDAPHHGYWQESWITREDGTFWLDRLPEGPTVVLAMHAGLPTALSAPIELDPETAAEVIIEMAASQGIHGRVYHEGRPAPVAAVTARRGDGTTESSAPVGELGLYALEGLFPGAYEITVQARSADGRILRAVRRAEVEEGKSAKVDVHLEAILFRGRVVQRGAPAPGKAVTVIAPSNRYDELVSCETDAAGRFALEVLPVSTLKVVIGVDETLETFEIDVPEGSLEVARDLVLGAFAPPADYGDGRTGPPAPFGSGGRR